ncbi:hypothetical protein RI065_11630 [Mycoplasmatota bacterium zrk1]
MKKSLVGMLFLVNGFLIFFIYVVFLVNKEFFYHVKQFGFYEVLKMYYRLNVEVMTYVASVSLVLIVIGLFVLFTRRKLNKNTALSPKNVISLSVILFIFFAVLDRNTHISFIRFGSMRLSGYGTISWISWTFSDFFGNIVDMVNSATPTFKVIDRPIISIIILLYYPVLVISFLLVHLKERVAVRLFISFVSLCILSNSLYIIGILIHMIRFPWSLNPYGSITMLIRGLIFMILVVALLIISIRINKSQSKDIIDCN